MNKLFDDDFFERVRIDMGKYNDSKIAIQRSKMIEESLEEEAHQALENWEILSEIDQFEENDR